MFDGRTSKRRSPTLIEAITLDKCSTVGFFATSVSLPLNISASDLLYNVKLIASNLDVTIDQPLCNQTSYYGPVSITVVCLVGWLVVSLVGYLVVCLFIWLFLSLVGWLVGWLVGLVGWLVGWFGWFGWLVGWLVNWLVGIELVILSAFVTLNKKFCFILLKLVSKKLLI
jgi:hypothetical protein